MSWRCRCRDIVTQMQTNMAAALNIDWALRLAAELMAGTGHEIAFSDLVVADRALARGVGRWRPPSPLYLRGRRARAVRQCQRPGGLHRVDQRASVPRPAAGRGRGPRIAARDCYAAMGECPGAPLNRRGRPLPFAAGVLAGAVQAPVRVSSREEAGAAGAAMMAAVAIGAYPRWMPVSRGGSRRCSALGSLPTLSSSPL